MSLSRSSLVVLLLFLATARAASAQSPYNEGYRGAFGVWIGGVVPLEEALENGLQGALSVEGYSSPRLSFRVEAGFGRPGVDHEFRHDVRRLYAEFDVLYNWEHGATHSYLGVGVGAYRYASTISSTAATDPVLREELIALGLDPDTAAGSHEKEIEIGANGVGGLEYLMSRSVSIAVEGGYRRVGRVFEVQPFDGSFLSASVGLKLYF